MDESIAKGGLVYEINVRGDFEKVIQSFENKLAELEARAKTLGKTIGTNVSSGVKSSNADTSESTKREVAAKAKIVTEEKAITAELNKQTKLALPRLQYEKALTGILGDQSKLQTDLAKAQSKLFSQSEIQNKARMEMNTLAAKQDIARISAETKIAYAREQGKITPQEISSATALSKVELAHYDAQLKATIEQDAEQAKLTKQMEVRNAKQLEDVAMQKEVRNLAKEQNISLVSAAKQVGLSATQAKRLGFEISHAQQFAENFFFTFRRLVGILAVFTIARKFAQFLGDGVREMIRFNAVLEETQIGFSAILASVGDIVDSNGKLLEGIDKYHAATKLSAEMMKQVRVEALSTVATFEELVKAVEAGIAPGISAGLTDMKELVKMISLISKAASTQGIKGSQFAEEIRAALTGQGSLRTTRLFQSGILDPAQIKQAREQGRLIEYLTEKLGPFAIASDEVAKSWNGLVSNFKDAIQILLSSGGIDYFDSLKKSLQGFISVLVDKQDLLAGGLGLNPDAVAGIEEVGSSLSDFIKEFQQVSSAEEVVISLRTNLMAVGEVFRTIGKLVAPLIVGLMRIGAVVSTIVGGVLKVANGLLTWLGNLPGIGTAFKQIYSFVGSILGALVIWAVLQKAIAAGLVAIEFLFGAISVIQGLWAATLTIIRLTILNINMGLTKTAALTAAITAVVSIWAVVAAVVAALIGVILYKTGLLSRGFDWINKTLGISKNTLKDSANNIKDMIFGIGAASTETKKLEESFKALEDKIAELAIKVKSMMLVSGIKGEAKEIFDTYADSYEELAKDIRKNKEEEEKLNKRIAENQAKYSDEQRRKAKELNKEMQPQQVGQRGGLPQRTDPLRLYDPTKSDRINAGIIASEKIKLALIEAQQKTFAEISQNETDIKTLEIERDKVQAAITEMVRLRTEELTKQLNISKINLDNTDGWLGGSKDITRQYDLQQAIADEILFNAPALTKELAQQTLEVAKQKVFYEREEALRADEVKKAEKIRNAMREVFAVSEDNQTQLFAQLRMLGQGFSVPILLDIINGKDVSQEVIKELQESLSELDLSEETEKILDIVFSLATAQSAYNVTVQETNQKRQTELAILQKQKNELERMAKLTVDQGFFSSIRNGFDVGIQDFVTASDTMAQGFAEAMSSALNDVVDRTANALTDLLDPRKQAPTAGEITGEVLLGLANSIFSTLIQQFAVSILTNLGLAQAPQVAALGINTAAITTLTGAIATLIAETTGQTAAEVANTIATTSDTVSTTANTASTTANTGGLLSHLGALVANTAGLIWHGVVLAAQTALWIAQMVANVAATIALTIATWASAISPFNKGGLVGRGFNSGGSVLKSNPYLFGNTPGYTRVVGYASGGNIVAFPRPRKIHPKDTVPAWLTPGEFVVQEPAVRYFGKDFLSRINAMRITPEMGEKILASRIKSHRGVYGFAGGGSVPRQAAVVGRAGDSTVQILPVMVADNNNVDQMLSGGRKMFKRNVNEVMGQGNPNASETWR
jgi:hypothetical protein